MKSIILLCILAVAFSATLDNNLFKDLFTQWKIAHGKSYSTSQEEDHRLLVFKDNYLKILLFNQQQKDVVLGLNQFADLTGEEFKAQYTGFIPSKSNGRIHHPTPVKDFPPVFDWREKGAVTPVKNQGSCGSCWAFSATGALEGFNFIESGKLVKLSEQLFVDCVYDISGCRGGYPEDAFQYSSLYGVETDEDYPYTGVYQGCKYDEDKAFFVNAGYAEIDPKNLTAFKTTLVQQPVSVGVQADQLVFIFYVSGVITTLCGDNLNHGVLVAGYDIILGTEAFIVKNSWGPKWGKDGYLYISTNPNANNGNGVCGILGQPSVPLNQ